VTSEIKRRKKEKRKKNHSGIKYKPFGIAMPCGLTTNAKIRLWLRVHSYYIPRKCGKLLAVTDINQSYNDNE